MSGGSYDYIYWKIEELAENIRNVEIDPRRATLQKVLVKLAKAMHDVEWVDSGDYGEGRDNEALDELFGVLGTSPSLVVKAAAYDTLKEQMLRFFEYDEVVK